MQIRSFAGIATGLAAAFIVLAGCTVVEERPGYRPVPPPRPGPVACTREYAPVCGERRGQRQTFANACMARADGYRIAGQGACRSGGNWGNRPDHNRPGNTRPGNVRPNDRDSRACTREYAPVCATRGRDSRTFSNACEARSANYRVNRPGRC